MGAPCPAGTVRLWIPVSLAVLAVLAYLFFYFLSATESQGASSFYLANVVGLFVVVAGVAVAALVVSRSSKPN